MKEKARYYAEDRFPARMYGDHLMKRSIDDFSAGYQTALEDAAKLADDLFDAGENMKYVGEMILALEKNDARPEYVSCILKEDKHSYCGRNVSMEFCFQSPEHANLNVKQEGRLVPCRECNAAVLIQRASNGERL